MRGTRQVLGNQDAPQTIKKLSGATSMKFKQLLHEINIFEAPGSSELDPKSIKKPTRQQLHLKQPILGVPREAKRCFFFRFCRFVGPWGAPFCLNVGFVLRALFCMHF